jgi:hypothetical protein
MHSKLIAAAMIAAGAAACASKSQDIQASYVSPITYQPYSCEQLRAEAQRVGNRVAQVSGVQDKQRSDDGGIVAVGAIIFWPALLFTHGDGATAAELARLKGEADAIEQASIQKKCGIEFRRAPPKGS